MEGQGGGVEGDVYLCDTQRKLPKSVMENEITQHFGHEGSTKLFNNICKKSKDQAFYTF
jgi:hypothetical protein